MSHVTELQKRAEARQAGPAPTLPPTGPYQNPTSAAGGGTAVRGCADSQKIKYLLLCRAMGYEDDENMLVS